jgi:hypothetical protein
VGPGTLLTEATEVLVAAVVLLMLEQPLAARGLRVKDSRVLVCQLHKITVAAEAALPRPEEPIALTPVEMELHLQLREHQFLGLVVVVGLTLELRAVTEAGVLVQLRVPPPLLEHLTLAVEVVALFTLKTLELAVLVL